MDGAQEIGSRLASRELDVTAGVFGEMDDIMIGIDDDRRRGYPLEQPVMQFAKGMLGRSARSPDGSGGEPAGKSSLAEAREVARETTDACEVSVSKLGPERIGSACLGELRRK